MRALCFVTFSLLLCERVSLFRLDLAENSVHPTCRCLHQPRDKDLGFVSCPILLEPTPGCRTGAGGFTSPPTVVVWAFPPFAPWFSRNLPKQKSLSPRKYRGQSHHRQLVCSKYFCTDTLLLTLFDDFSDFLESITCETSKTCQVRGSRHLGANCLYPVI